MNYAQILEQLEQLKTGKKVSVADIISNKKSLKKILYIPEQFLYDFVGEYVEAILKEHKFTVARVTKYAMKRPLGHILYNGKPVSQKDFAKYGENILKKIDCGDGLTKSEVIYEIAWEMCLDKQVDFLILPCDEQADFEEYKKRYLNTSVTFQKEVEKEIVISFLEREDIALNEKSVEKAMAKCKREGKFELLKKKPYFLADGADDAESVKFLMAKLQYSYPNNAYIFIVGTMKEGFEEIVKESSLMAQQVITVTPWECRNALPAIELAQEFGKINPNITNASSMEEAIEIATILADKETVVVAFGTTAILSGYRDVVLKGINN